MSLTWGQKGVRLRKTEMGSCIKSYLNWSDVHQEKRRKLLPLLKWLLFSSPLFLLLSSPLFSFLYCCSYYWCHHGDLLLYLLIVLYFSVSPPIRKAKVRSFSRIQDPSLLGYQQWLPYLSPVAEVYFYSFRYVFLFKFNSSWFVYFSAKIIDLWKVIRAPNYVFLRWFLYFKDHCEIYTSSVLQTEWESKEGGGGVWMRQLTWLDGCWGKWWAHGNTLIVFSDMAYTLIYMKYPPQ